MDRRDIRRVTELWRVLNKGRDQAWAVFENGTCVLLDPLEPNKQSKAKEILGEWGPVQPGTSSADFDLEPNALGTIVTCHSPDVLVHIPALNIDQASLEEKVQVGVQGRSIRHADSQNPKVVHLHPQSGAPRTEDEAAWLTILENSFTAVTSWGRYGIPYDAIRFLKEAELGRPRRSYLDLPQQFQDMARGLQSLQDRFGNLQKPVQAWTGLSFDQPRMEAIEYLFSPGQHLELTGYVSASRAISPPAYAAGEHGVLLEIRLHKAAPVSLFDPSPGEDEFLLPLDTICRVDEIRGSTPFSLDGQAFHRRTIALTQVN